MLGACTGPAAIDLNSVPAGDLPWRHAIRAAREQQRAAQLCAQIAEIARHHPDRWEPAWADLDCRAAMLETGVWLQQLQRTLELAESQAELEGIATLSHWVGVAQQQLGDLPAARASYRRAQEAALAAQRSDLAAYAESAMAGLLVETGELAAAASQLESAAQRLRGLGYENELEAVEFNRAVIAIELGNAAVAARVFERIALAPARPGGTQLQDAAALNLGSLELARRRLPQAKAWLDRVVPASPEDRAIKSLALATLHLRSGELDPAQAQLDNCTSADSQLRSPTVLDCEALRVEWYRRRGRFDLARQHALALIDEADRNDAQEPAWIARWQLARVERSRRDDRQARQWLEQAARRIEEQQQGIDPSAEGLTFLRERIEPFVDLALLDAHDPDRLLPAMRRCHAQSLRRGAEALSARSGRSELMRIQARLAPGTALLAYAIGDESGVVLAIDATGVRSGSIIGSRQLAPQIEQLRQIVARGQPVHPDQALRDALLAPAGEILRRNRRWIIVPDRELHLLPFALLADPSDAARFVIEDRFVALSPFIATPNLDRERASEQAGTVLLAGVPTFEPGDPFRELPWSGYELSQLRRLWGDRRAELLVGESFAPAEILRALAEPRAVVHFAAHATASTLDPAECGVVTSRGVRLTLDQLAGANLDRTLVVFSACETGQGELVPGEGVVGLSWAASRAGAQAVVASHWAVDDAHSARLMVDFHRRLASRIEPVEALAQAQRRALQIQLAARHWAAHTITLRPRRH